MITQGKWTVIDRMGKAFGVRTESGFLCFMREISKYTGQNERYERELKENADNACLIAASKDLLEACKSTVAQIGVVLKAIKEKPEYVETILMAVTGQSLEAIDKATN